MSFGFGFALPHWQTLSGGFSPASLFVGGVQGTWFDPSDPATLFEDTAGTIPCGTPGATVNAIPVGLMLDKSQGLALGSELVTIANTSLTAWDTAGMGNNTFALDGVNGWKLTYVDNLNGPALRLSTDASSPIGGLSTNLTVGKFYRITFEAQVNTGSVQFIVNRRTGSGSDFVTFNVSNTSFQTYSATFQEIAGANARDVLYVYNSLNAGEIAWIRNISIKELPGNHAISYNTTTARPVLSARVNLLTFSEQFDNVVWGRGVFTVNANQTNAPDGTLTADEIITGASSGYIVQSNTALNGANRSAISTIYIKNKNCTSSQTLTINMSDGVVGSVIINFKPFDGSFTVGSVVSWSNITRTVTNVGDGWWKLTLSGTTTQWTSGWLEVAAGGFGGNSFYLWGADLRPTNIGASVPAYQRIADQYTYDSSGFPRYLVFNGTASGMYTPANLNLSGTDKATVFAGVRKLSDAATGIVTELSAVASSNNGSFAFFNSSGSANYTSALQGTATYSSTYTTFTAPITNVASFSYNIAGATGADEVSAKFNGVTTAPSSTSGSSAGTGNFGTYPLYIGSRNNASFFLNGYIYSLIVVGAASTAAQISSTESWINVKEGGVY